MKLEQVLEDVSTMYSIPLEDLKSRYVESDTSVHTQPTHNPSKKNTNTMLNSYSMSIYNTPQDPPPAKKRGRKKKQKEEFIEMEEYVFNDTTYLIDTNNNVSTFNIEAPRLIGERFVDGTIHLFPASSSA